MSAADLLRDLNRLDEHPRIEAKTGSALGKAAMRTVCAFANEPHLGGGHILFGVQSTDDLFGARYEAVGVPDPDGLQADLASQCRTMFNRPVRPEIQVETVDEKVLVAVFIPESQPGDKPVYFEAQGTPRGAYRRIGSSDQRCTDDDMLVFYEGRQRQTFDRDPVPGTSMSDLDPDAINEYRRERARARPSAEELEWSDEDLLIGIGCAHSLDGKVVLTVAGVLLFGTPVLLRRLFPMVRLDYIRVPGHVWIEDPDRRFETLDMRGPIIRLIRRGEAAILDDLPRRFHLEPGELQRRDVPRIPERVVREAVVNALMHRSYRRQGPTQIIRYTNRIEIRNPGHSLKAEDQFGEPGSETRNPAIAAVLHETDFAETKGSGIRVMRRLMREVDLAPPTFRSNREADEFVATLFLHNLLDEEDLEWLQRFAEMNLTTDEKRALVHVREAGRIANAEYRELGGTDTLDASSHLRHLRDLGLLDQQDRGAATYYTPTEKLLAELDERGGQAPDPTEQPTKLGEKPTKLEEQSTKLDGESILDSEESSGLARLLAGLPMELQHEVEGLDRWIPQPVLRTLVRRLCAHRPYSAQELAVVTGRSVAYLRRAYIRPLLKEGLLRYTNPKKPNDPNQRYRATGPSDD